MSRSRAVACFAIIPLALALGKSDLVADTFRAITAQDIREEMARDEEHRRQLDEENRVIQRQIEIKEMLLRELIAGRQSLRDVVGQFQAINEEHPEYLFVIEREFPGASIEEKSARNVLAFVEAEMAGRFPTRSLPVFVRLEAEFREHFANPRSAKSTATH